ncbi:UNVERIFIED_CONTAM: PAS-domain containing protein, partial [Bacteroidetes bacterium 56_B9]
ASVAATYDDFLRDADRTNRSMALMIAENDRLTSDLEATIQALGLENAGYAPALENMSHGLCIFDACNRLVIANAQYRAIYGLPEELVRPGVA